MPLIDLGLVQRFNAADAAHLGQGRAPSQRMVRCVAGFYGGEGAAGTAEAVARHLQGELGLQPGQVQVIRPAGLTRHAYRHAARRWQQLRPRWGLAGQVLQLLAAAAAGLLAGGLSAALGWVLLQPDSAPAAEPLAWLWPGMWAGALIGALVSGAMAWRQPRHRFDDTVARKLRQGCCVVVAHGLDEAQEAPALACLQDSSHSWCAEAPQRCERL